MVLPMLTRSSFPSMLASIAVPPAIQWWWTGHLHTGFLMDILYVTLGLRLPEPWWTVGASGKSLDEHPFSHWTLNSGCNQQLVKSSPDDTPECTIESLTQIGKGHVQCVVDGMATTPEAFNISAVIRDVPAALPHFISLMDLLGFWERDAGPSTG